MKVGFAGLGQMGRPMAHNLRRSGAGLIVTSRSGRGFEAFRAAGAQATTDVAALAQADIVFLCLPGAAAVQALLLGADGLAARLGAGQVVVDLGTTDHAATLAIGRALEAAGIGFLDAPVSGMEARAIDGTLTVMCGGTVAVFERVRPLLEHLGSTILHMGPCGSGQLAKLVNQLLFDINAAALGEVLPMAASMGLDPALIGQVINSGTGRSYASEFFIPRILQGRFTDGYPMQDAYKDLVGGAALSAGQCVPMPVLAAATATYQAALRQGLGALDKGAMVQVFEALLGVEYRQRGDSP